ncbi:Golgi-associated plant pathogenesis-related protein 1 [Orchesella cincta]|uniref:Golgi-associated plant pathogenesis-related protein 1 n=1 Tax=Orchesella cincta TaxID=48709 RepID=A0A1D2MAI7_ORCCI|nr:Golgi-associated plant pathogenesis-related protein 1 [Orchesella cincta]
MKTTQSAFAHATILGVIFLTIPQCDCRGREEVIFFSDPFYEGDRLFITLAQGCYTIDDDWINRISSVDTQGACIMAYEQGDCKGPSVKLAPGQRGLGHLGRLSFDNVLSSISICKDAVSLNQERNKEIDGPVPEIWKFAVEEHNKYRKMHGVPNLRGDPMLHRTAQQHADYLVRNIKFEASDNKYGENLATSYKADKFDAIRDAVQRWYDKIEFYDFRNPESNKQKPRGGQFSSIIWKATTHVGIGIAQHDKEKKWVVVANYDPPAKTSKYAENVPPPVRRGQMESPRVFRTRSRGN